MILDPISNTSLDLTMVDTGNDSYSFEEINTIYKLPVTKALAQSLMGEPQAQVVYRDQANLTGGFKYWFEIALYNYLYNEMATRNVTLPDGTSFPQVDLPPYYAYYNPLLGVGKTKWTKPNPRNLTFTTLVFPILLEVVLSQNTVNILNVVSDFFTHSSFLVGAGYIPVPFFYGNIMRYAAITVNLTVVPDTLGYSEGLAIRDRWEDLISEKV